MSAPELGADGARWDGEWPRRGPSRALRLWVPVVISFLVQVPGSVVEWQGTWGRLQSAHAVELRAGWPGSLALALIGPVALIGARRFPGPVVAVVAGAAITDLLILAGTPGPPYIALAFAILGAIVRGARVWAWSAVGAVWLGALAAVLLRGAAVSPGRIAFTTFGVLAMLGIGEAVRARQERIAAYRRANAQRRQTAAEAERVRIARELHDVLAHSLSSINVQAGVGLHLMERDPAQAAAALAEIKATSKTALDEVRSVLGVLRADDTTAGAPLVPEPDLSQLQRLTARVSAQGVSVTLDLPPDVAAAGLPRQVQLAVYRIVQESLTNVVRHANARHATVSVRLDGADVVADVTDDGSGKPGTGSGGGSETGRGILGMRERAELLGGTLDAGPRPGGGYRVTARIPSSREDAP
ncbi:sensor histidine kinase [Lysobacter korlensis]|uniref:histidine kinase n=1 Tax=Lysobacter korlensis TaxID=553636 RepID=A0ABV6RZB1_9GAMM